MAKGYPKKHGKMQIPLPYYWVVAMAVVFFLIDLRLISWIPVPKKDRTKIAKVKIITVPKKEEKEKKEDKEDKKEKQMVETELEETLKPLKSDFLGKKNHQTAKETKWKNPRQNSQKAGNTKLDKIAKALKQSKSREKNQNQKQKPKKKLELKPDKGPIRHVPQGTYQKLLPNLRELSLAKGQTHQDYITKDIADGDVLDVNTTEYKWIGYFTKVRKSVAQTLYNPHASIGRKKEIADKIRLYGKAKMKGSAKVKLTIAQSGLLIESKLISSSGDKEVDEFWQKILNLSAPFPPLPKHYEKDTLSFTYGLDYHFEWRRQENLGHTRDPSAPPF